MSDGRIAARHDSSSLEATGVESDPGVVLGVLDRIYAWRERRPGFTILGAHVGRLLLTSRRLLFLSTGSNGILQPFAYHLLGGLPAQIAFGETRTDELDTGALVNPGSLNLGLERIARAEVRRRIDVSSYLAIEIPRRDGSVRHVSFMTRHGLERRPLVAFRDALERARAALPEADLFSRPGAGSERPEGERSGR